MKLFYKPGACSMAAHLILNEAGATFQLEKVDTEAGTTETGASYANTNPRGYVPALQLANGEILTENVAVLQWLSEQLPGFASNDNRASLDRYRQLELLSFLSSELHKAFGPYFSGLEYSDPEKATHARKLNAKIAQFDELLSADSPFLMGDAFSVADAYAFVILNWTNFIGVSLSEWPKTKAYVARIASRPAAQQTLKEEGLAA